MEYKGNNIKENKHKHKHKLHAIHLINQTSQSSPVCSLPVYLIVLEIILIKAFYLIFYINDFQINIYDH